MRTACLLLTLSACLLTACGEPEHPRQQPAPRIFGSQRDALDKAKGVQNTLDQANQQRRAEEEAQTR
jgi:hypothetical protein